MLPVPRSIARIPILGLHRVALNGYARLSRGRYTVEERMGLRLLLDLDNVVDQQIFVSGAWEKEIIDTLFGLVREERQRHRGDAVFVDIGAHWASMRCALTGAACSSASWPSSPTRRTTGNCRPICS